MRNFLQDGNMIRVAAPYAVATGDGCQVGAMFGLAGNTAAIGEILDLITIGEMRFTALSTDTGAVGTAMYWDNTNRRLTTTADAWVSVGVLTQAKTSGQTTAVIRLGMGHQASNSVLTKRDPVTGKVAGLVSPEGGTTPLMGLLSFTADDTGMAWASCPKLLDLTATLASGGTTTVLLEVRSTAGVVSTAATITADTVSQVLRQTFTSRGNQDFRVRRSSGTGSVTITL